MDPVALLCRLIETPSVSRHEEATAALLFDEMTARGLAPRRVGNNVYAVAPSYDPSRPTLLLNSHHDTVPPSAAYTRSPHAATLEEGRLYGLGSNDAGASGVALLEAFTRVYRTPLPYNLILALTAEEEVGGEGGMRLFLPHILSEGYRIDAAIVGEPTEMQAAVGERGLLVFDAVTTGVTGHAARGEGINAIYRAMADIEALRAYRFERTSTLLGPITLNVTQINAGRAHNVIPDECRWVVDVRTTDAYSNPDTVELLRKAVSRHTTLTPRSTRVHASAIAATHPLVEAAVSLGAKTFVSPTTSDMSLLHDIPSLKIGPGSSSRSHSADEWVEAAAIPAAADFYTSLLLSLTTL